MVILIVNKFLFRNGGSEACMFDTADLLREHGHRIVFLSMEHPRNLRLPDPVYLVSTVDFASSAPRDRARAAARMLYSREARALVERVIEEERPDIALLHNVYHHLSPSILAPLARRRVPALMTLHDYKLVCPVYTLFSRGRPCRRCRRGAYQWCIARRCSRGSLVASALVAAEMLVHRRLLRSYDTIAAFLSPSRFLLDTLVEMGFSGPLHHLPNFIDSRAIEPCTAATEPTFVCFGRLTPEKGLPTLVAAMEGVPAACHIVGDGPLAAPLRRAAADRGLTNVRFTPHLPFDQLTGVIAGARAVVVPSEWYENSPRAVLESFALGKPVIGARIGGIPELVRDGVTGLTFEPGNADDLRRAVVTLVGDERRAATMGAAARRLVEAEHAPQAYYDRLMTLCRQALAAR